MALTPREAILDVKRKYIPLDRVVLPLSVPPPIWTVVRRHADARRVALTMGERYAVCPSCRNRAPLKGGPPSARCAPHTAASSSQRRIAIIPWAGARPAAPSSGNSANWCRCLHSKVAAVTHSGLGLAIP